MKIRWTESSIRCRITPTEFAAIQRGESVCETINLPGSLRWSVAIVPVNDKTALTAESGVLQILLSENDRRCLAESDREGVYFQTGDTAALRYFVEKDFPCAHPSAAEALEYAGKALRDQGGGDIGSLAPPRVALQAAFDAVKDDVRAELERARDGQG